jgi:hypothetical protein
MITLLFSNKFHKQDERKYCLLMPQSLQLRISDALAAMRQHPLNDLNLGWRWAIYAAFGSRLLDEETIDMSGYLRRTALACLSVRKVLPIWERAKPADRTAHQILAQAEQVLHAQVNPQTLTQKPAAYWTLMDGYIYHAIKNGEDTTFVLVGYGAACALSVALWDEKFDPNRVDYNLTEASFDPYEWDVAFHTAAAYSGGVTWRGHSNSVKRREFWQWWLTEAVPKAWAAFP